jgi:flavin reductase (DIM6/NTAB) family NADH-FMN oxidoreductase RutF
MDRISDAFRHAFRHHPSGVAILTTQGRAGPVAVTISSLISVSAEPPLVAFSLSSASRSAAEFLQAETLVIHFPRHADQALALLCATPGSDRFAPGVAWEPLPTGEPRYSAVETWFRARIRDRLPVDGATLVTAEFLDGRAEPAEAAVLVYLDRHWHGLGNGKDVSERCV